MDWIDENIAIGSWVDAHCVRILKKERIDLMIDSRTLFTRASRLSRNVPDIALVERSAELMTVISKHKVKVLVYCRHGKDRSPFLAAVYFSRRYGVPFDEAYRLIGSKRSRTVYHPEWAEMLVPIEHE